MLQQPLICPPHLRQFIRLDDVPMENLGLVAPHPRCRSQSRLRLRDPPRKADVSSVSSPFFLPIVVMRPSVILLTPPRLPWIPKLRPRGHASRPARYRWTILRACRIRQRRGYSSGSSRHSRSPPRYCLRDQPTSTIFGRPQVHPRLISTKSARHSFAQRPRPMFRSRALLFCRAQGK